MKLEQWLCTTKQLLAIKTFHSCLWLLRFPTRFLTCRWKQFSSLTHTNTHTYTHTHTARHSITITRTYTFWCYVIAWNKMLQRKTHQKENDKTKIFFWPLKAFGDPPLKNCNIGESTNRYYYNCFNCKDHNFRRCHYILDCKKSSLDFKYNAIFQSNRMKLFDCNLSSILSLIKNVG